MTSDNSFFELLDQINHATTSEDDVSCANSSQDVSAPSRAAIDGDDIPSTHRTTKDPSDNLPSQANTNSVLGLASSSDILSGAMSSREGVTRDEAQPLVQAYSLYEKSGEPVGPSTPLADTRTGQSIHAELGKSDQAVATRSPSSSNASKPSSQATTVSCNPSPQQVRNPMKCRSLSSGYEEMMRQERDLEELKSPGMDYASVFARLAREAIPSPGPVRRNQIRHRSPATLAGELVSDISDDESLRKVNTRPKATGPSKNTKRKRGRQIAEDEGEVSLQPPVMKRTATEPILQSQRQPRHSPVATDTRSRPSSSRKAPKDGFRRKPVAQQFLRGKVFFWVPNDEKLLGRRIRMDRSEEWGAERSIAVTPRVTHVIIEENWDYQYALRYLGLSTLPKHIVVVNEKWVSASIEMRQLADSHATRFRVKGHQEAMERERQEQEQSKALHTVEEDSQAHNGYETAFEHDLESPSLRSSARLAPQGTDDDPGNRPSSVPTEDYEVPDSQLSNIPSSPADLPRTPTRNSRTELLLQSLEVKRDKRDVLPSTPETPEDPHRRKTFVAEKQMPSKPLRWDTDAPARKRDKRAPLTDDTTPFVTPAAPTPSTAGSITSSPNFKDELDLAIDETKDLVVAGLASELESRPSSSDAAERDSDIDDDRSQSSPMATSVKTRSKAFSPRSWQETFACMHAHETSTGSGNPNMATMQILQEMADHYELVKDHWRLTAYRKAIGKLKLQTSLIATAEQARNIHGIGDRIADKIEEIVTKGNLRQLDAIKQDAGPQDVALKLFTQVYGAGIRQAHKWIAEGHRTVKDLRTKATLTENQRVGVEHFEDFQQRIPRAEVTAHAELMNKICVEISWKLRVVVGGSYRRGAESSGDVDFLITTSDEKQPDHVLRSMVFEQLIPRLFEIGYLKVRLAGSSSSDSSTKWHGAAVIPDRSAPGPAPSAGSSSSHGVRIPDDPASSCKATSSSPAPWRRVDILMVPPSEWGAALLYFTGNDIFNRSMRLLARKKGYCLNQRGLYRDVMRGSNREKLAEGTLVEGKDEKRIFEILGVPYRPPEHRVC